MQVTIKPWAPGDGGFACLPLTANLPDAAEVRAHHPDWKPVQCPVCGADCWESELARQAQAAGAHGACTSCALQKGLSVKGGS